MPCHDSQKLDDVLDKSDTGTEVWADSAYRPAEMEAKFEAHGYKSRVPPAPCATGRSRSARAPSSRQPIAGPSATPTA